jgi:uncharacterized protein YbjQ (UPF0145 family)
MWNEKNFELLSIFNVLLSKVEPKEYIMPMCKECGNVVSVTEIEDGLCSSCRNAGMREKREKRQARQAELDRDGTILNSIWITTEKSLPEEIDERIGIVSSHIVYGMNIGKNLLTDIRDIVGGRVGNIEKSIKKANEEALDDIKKQAYLLDADAVIGVNLQYEIISSMLSVSVYGTAVKLA